MNVDIKFGISSIIIVGVIVGLLYVDIIFFGNKGYNIPPDLFATLLVATTIIFFNWSTIRKRATEKGAGFSNKDRYFLLVFESSISSNLVGLIMSATGGTPIILIALLALSALSLVLSTILVSLIIFTHNF